MSILVTGANGIVGCELVRSLVAERDGEDLQLLLRGTRAEIAAKVRWLARWAGLGPVQQGRLSAVAGDVTEPGLGLSRVDAERLAGEVTGVLHSAAVTSFSQSEEQAFRNNVMGTKNVLAFAAACPRLARFGQISTTYVAGRRCGEIREDDLDLDAGFFNEYEHSKAVAEVEALKSGLPVAVYRVGLVVGRSTDGQIARMLGPYLVLRLLYEGLVAMFPGEQDQIIDLVPSDFAGSAVSWLFRHAFVPGATYHVCAGPKRSFTMPQFIDALAESVGRVEPEWTKRGLPIPVAVSADTFRKFMHTIELVANPTLKAVVRQVDEFMRPIESPKLFDTTRFDQAIAPSGLSLGHVREWLPNVVRHAVTARFRQPNWEAMDDEGGGSR